MAFTPDSTLQAINMSTYDMVVAVTQLAINETMGEYLYSQPQKFNILGIADANGNITQLTNNPSLSNCSLQGTLALEKDPNTGKYINLVNLTTDKGNQTVQYNVTMQNGDFKFNAAGINFEAKQTTAAPWIFQMFVNLGLQKVAKSNLPQDLQNQLAHIDENMFSIQRLYMDLNTASLNSIQGATFPSLVQTPAMQLLKLYLAQQQAQNAPLFGVTVSYSNRTVAPPTLTPTFVDFCITPYTDQSGKKSNPNLDTLNYLMMVNNNPPPKNPPQSFNFNWVTDIQNHGAVAIKENDFTSFVISQLNPILKSLSPVMHCKADGHQSSPNDVVIQLNPGVDHVFNSVFNPTTGQIGSSSYTSADSNTDTGPWYAQYTLIVSGNYASVCNIFLLQNTISLQGSITASGSTYTHFSGAGGGSSNEVDMPATTYNWSVELELYFDAQQNGQLDLKITNPNFTSDPVVAQHDKSWWETFLGALGGYMQSYVNNLGDLRGSVSSSIEGNIQTNLNSVLNKANHFIFPGGKTFAFKNPQFSNTKDLVSNITYLNPNA